MGNEADSAWGGSPSPGVPLKGPWAAPLASRHGAPAACRRPKTAHLKVSSPAPYVKRGCESALSSRLAGCPRVIGPRRVRAIFLGPHSKKDTQDVHMRDFAQSCSDQSRKGGSRALHVRPETRSELAAVGNSSLSRRMPPETHLHADPWRGRQARQPNSPPDARRGEERRTWQMGGRSNISLPV